MASAADAIEMFLTDSQDRAELASQLHDLETRTGSKPRKPSAFPLRRWLSRFAASFRSCSWYASSLARSWLSVRNISITSAALAIRPAALMRGATWKATWRALGNYPPSARPETSEWPVDIAHVVEAREPEVELDPQFRRSAAPRRRRLRSPPTSATTQPAAAFRRIPTRGGDQRVHQF